MTLEKYTVGVGDRFAHQAEAQLQACVQLAADGIEVVPVWNKSNREHSFIGSEPQSVYDAAKEAVEALGWDKGWHVDADHINLDTVDKYLDCSDFFTIDVADFIGQPPEGDAVAVFVGKHPELVGSVSIEGIDAPLEITREYVETVAGKYLRGAWLLSDGSEATAIKWYARGYYYEAKRRGMLVETGLRKG